MRVLFLHIQSPVMVFNASKCLLFQLHPWIETANTRFNLCLMLRHTGKCFPIQVPCIWRVCSKNTLNVMVTLFTLPYWQNLPLMYQLLYLIIWGRVYLWMYVSVWILSVSDVLFTISISFYLIEGGSLHLYRNYLWWCWQRWKIEVGSNIKCPCFKVWVVIHITGMSFNNITDH